ncbi:hypothetical protein CJF30_00007653 [Rutstroemia sp. NJR-2017a BBW]|nr:hypothetical protein CJF30_00007653 [Rutstroemia sp. NJR-2017a BBW]
MARRRRNQIKFWASNNSCRFQEHECRDLHEHRDDTAGTNFRDGRVTTWGSIRDYVDPVPEPPAGEEHAPAKDPSTTAGKEFTCHFWASGFCHHSEDRCKFLHTQGVLKKPVALAAIERYRKEEKEAKKVPEQVVKEPRAELNESWRAPSATDGGLKEVTNNDWSEAVASDWGQTVNNSSWDDTANNGWGMPAGDDWGQPTQNGWFLMEGEQREELSGEDENTQEVDEQKDETYTPPVQEVEPSTISAW